MNQETSDLSQIESYQRLKTYYGIPPCLTLSSIMHISRVQWSNPGKEYCPSLHLSEVAFEKRSLRFVHDYGHQLYSLLYYHYYIPCTFLTRERVTSNLLSCLEIFSVLYPNLMLSSERSQLFLWFLPASFPRFFEQMVKSSSPGSIVAEISCPFVNLLQVGFCC